MKNIFILLSVFCLTIHSNAQIINRGTDTKEFQQMMNSKLTFVLTGKAAYDKKLSNAIHQYWKVTPIDSVSVKDLNKVIQDESRSFLLPILFGLTFDFKPGTSGHQYSSTKSWLSIINGGQKELSKYSDNDAICIAAISLYGNEANFEDCEYRLDYIVKGLNDAIELALKKKMTGGAASMPFKMIAEINKNKNILNEKTLVINKDLKNVYRKDIAEEKDFTKNYTSKYKFVSDKEFKEILSSNSEEYVCLMPVLEVNKHILIYEPSTKKTIFYGHGMSGLSVNKKDIKEMLGK